MPAGFWQYLVYPLVIRIGEWIYEKYIQKTIDDKYKLRQKKREAIVKAIKNANTNEERQALSIVLSDLK